jgi:hypothetical protein
LIRLGKFVVALTAQAVGISKPKKTRRSDGRNQFTPESLRRPDDGALQATEADRRPMRAPKGPTGKK